MVIIRKIRTFFRLRTETRYRAKLRKRINNKEFTIISNNCWGGGIYEDLGLPYRTPTVGLFFYGPCYIRFLTNLKDYLALNLIFTETSKYDLANQFRKTKNLNYPIGILNDIEIHFLHYHSIEEANEKWDRRKKRINFNNLFLELGENELVDYAVMKEFDELHYVNKLIFTVNCQKDLKSSIWLTERSGMADIGDIYTNKKIWRKEFDVVTWLNQGKKSNL